MLTPLSLTGLSLRELPYGSRLLVGQAHGVPCRHTQTWLVFSGISQQVCMYVSLVRLSIPWRKHLRTCLLLYLYSLQYRYLSVAEWTSHKTNVKSEKIVGFSNFSIISEVSIWTKMPGHELISSWFVYISVSKYLAYWGVLNKGSQEGMKSLCIFTFTMKIY